MKRTKEENTNPNKVFRPNTPDMAPAIHRDPVQVFCRLRPLQEESESPCVKLLSPTTLSLSAESKLGRKECNYVFRHVFTAYTGQREVFEHVAMPLLEDLLKGKNGLLFTYGVTGSGKTYTLTGEPSLPGIMPRCINALFNTIDDVQAQKFLIKSDRMNCFEVQTENDALEDRLIDMKTGGSKRPKPVTKRAGGDCKNLYDNDGTKLAAVNPNSLYSVFISYTEIYNNTVYDLLDESSGKVLQAKIIREDSQKNMYVNGVVEVEVKSAVEAFELFYVGQRRKRMGHTILNAESSRSHSIFNIRLVQLEQPPQGVIPERNLLRVGQLSLVDLAGSERCSRTQNTGVRLKEASSINNSLMSLRACLEILRENQAGDGSKLVPYRDSRLTLLFKSYFEGEGQVRMIVCVNPSNQDCEENLQVLKFAEMTQDVKVPRAESRYTPYKNRKTPKQTKTPIVPNSAISKAKKTLSFTFGPKIPTVKMCADDSSDVATLDNLLKILQQRKHKGAANKRELRLAEDHFRKRLTQINQDSAVDKSEIRSQKMLVKKEKQATRNLNARLVELEGAHDALAADNDNLQEMVRTLRNTIDEKNLRINQNQLEREKSKQKLALQSEKMNQELDEKLRQQRLHLQAVMQAKDVKIQKAKEILDNNVVTVDNRQRETRCEEVVSDEPEEQTQSQPQPSAVAGRRHRRSRSAGEVWLEHNAVKPVALGTVLQPAMKKRKSVTKLKKACDITNPKQSKYCLVSQEADVVGDLETRLYKGDILPTCCGGAQVVFNDVECLRQESPTAISTTPLRK